jgi:hypothetical protein
MNPVVFGRSPVFPDLKMLVLLAEAIIEFSGTGDCSAKEAIFLKLLGGPGINRNSLAAMKRNPLIRVNIPAINHFLLVCNEALMFFQTLSEGYIL